MPTDRQVPTEHASLRSPDRRVATSSDDAGAMAWARFARAEQRDAACHELTALGFVVVEIEGIGPSARGRLGEIVDDAIERELRARGAGGPGMFDLGGTGDVPVAESAESPSGRQLGDQLYRARRGGARGIAVVLGPLRAAAGAAGALEPVDCGALRGMAEAARDRAFVLILDARDARTGGYADPVPLERLLDVRAVGEGVPREPSIGKSTAPCPGAHGVSVANSPRDSAGETLPDGEGGPARPDATPTRSAARPEGAPAAISAVDRERDEPWRSWMLTLAAARGPQPLTSLEKLFIESYVPLDAAIALGLDDPRARAIHGEFRASFVRSYTDAFATFASTTKRPRMVLDVHETASRIARLHGARSTRLLLVDAMRWDLSRLVAERLAARLGSRAALTDELLLWSALPTTTMRQLETIARGVEALRAPGELEPDDPPRGRTSEYIRRMRVGSRELHKLDLVEGLLGAARGSVIGALPDIADAASEVIARHAVGLMPHTLLFVFGDHGFSIDRGGSAQQGGASPEEVLVGAFALLVGDVN